MRFKKVLFLGLGGCFLFTSAVFADTFISFSNTQEKQEQNFTLTGQYKTIEADLSGTRVDKIIKWNGVDKKEQHAYAIVQETPTQIISTGYGDKLLSTQLTYTYEKPIDKPTTTRE